MRHILCYTDLDDSSTCALRFAVDLALHVRATLLLTHVIMSIPPMPPDPMYVFVGAKAYRQFSKEYVNDYLAHLVRRHVPESLCTKIILRSGDLVRQLVMTIEEESVDLIVVPLPVRTTWCNTPVAISVAGKLMGKIDIPLVCVPSSLGEATL